MISMVRSPAEVEQAVRWAKFWPRGERGLNGGNRDGRYGLVPLAEYTARANAETFIGVQIETAGASRRSAEIAAIPDVDLLFVGPSDLSQVLGVTGDFENPRCLEAIESIAQASAAAGKPWGVFSRGPDYAARMKDLGLPALRHRRRHPRGACRHPRRQGPVRRLLPPPKLTEGRTAMAAFHACACRSTRRRRRRRQGVIAEWQFLAALGLDRDQHAGDHPP